MTGGREEGGGNRMDGMMRMTGFIPSSLHGGARAGMGQAGSNGGAVGEQNRTTAGIAAMRPESETLSLPLNYTTCAAGCQVLFLNNICERPKHATEIAIRQAIIHCSNNVAP